MSNINHEKYNRDRNMKIKAEIAMRDFTRENIATLLNISSASVINKLKGKTQWSIIELEKLSEIFNKDRRYFF